MRFGPASTGMVVAWAWSTSPRRRRSLQIPDCGVAGLLIDALSVVDSGRGTRCLYVSAAAQPLGWPRHDRTG